MVSVSLTPDPIKSNRYLIHGLHHLVDDPVRMRMAIRSHVWRPPTDVYETEDAVIIRVEIAGMDETGFSIVLDEQYLLIRGMRVEQQERRAYHQMEIRYGEFGTEIELPYPVVAANIEAVYSNGFLRIVLPKARPQRINIEE